jgi:dipeptidase D
MPVVTGCRLSGGQLHIKGLKGGHSGADIHLGRGNANKLLVRLLRELEAKPTCAGVLQWRYRPQCTGA